tara:strand:- start:12392 stop:13096 length:705 start_codon:yes stop_codon:yes gene_type:complete
MINLFKSKTQKWQKVKDLWQTPSTWHVIDYNRHQFNGQSNVLHLERHNQNKNPEIINFYSKSREIDFNFGPLNSAQFALEKHEWNIEVIQTLERQISTQIDLFTQILKANPPLPGDPLQEAKGQEWLKTTLLVLERALENMTSEQTLQASLFAGEKNGHQEFRFIVFNLDLSLRYDTKKKILIAQCFNKKDQPEFDYQKPDFEGAFAALAFPVFDQAINLAMKISTALIKEVSR